MLFGAENVTGLKVSAEASDYHGLSSRILTDIVCLCLSVGKVCGGGKGALIEL